MPKTLTLLMALVLPVILCDGARAGGLDVGRAGANFSFDDGGREGTFQGILDSEGTKAVVVVVTSYTCPYSLRADEELVPLSAELAAKGVRILAVYPNRSETAEGVGARAKSKGFGHRAVRDPEGKVARMLGAEVTPTFFLFDSAGVLRYRGNLAELVGAVDAVLAGDEVSDATTSATGCTVKWPESGLPERPVPPGPEAAEQPRPGDGGIGRGPPGGPAREERRGPPPLSEAASTWLGKLLEMLDSGDPAVTRSASAGILALGPAALPHLERARKGAEGRKAEALDRILPQVRRGGRPGEGPGRAEARPGGRTGRRFSLLDFQVRMIEENLELSEEQRQALRDVLVPLKEREAALLAKRDSGVDREALRSEASALMEEARAALGGILTPDQRRKLDELREQRMRDGGRRPGERRPGREERDR